MNGDPHPSAPPPEPPSPAIVPGLSDDQLSRTNSMPSGMNLVDNAVQLRLTPTRSHRKAQYLRNSVAVTNSDYYNQWRPQISPLVRLHSSGGLKPAQSLDTISEYDIELQASSSRDQWMHQSREPVVADPNMFRYTPTPILDPARQTVPAPLSRPTTPQVGSTGFSQPPVSSFSPTGPGTNATSLLRGSSQAIHITAAATNQFLPIFLNPETGNVYMFEDGYYVPMSSKNIKELERATNMNALTTAPAPDRRSITLPTPPPDRFKFVMVVASLSLLCLNIPVLMLLLLPSLLCSHKVRMYNSLGSVDRARTCHEWTLCSSITGLLLLVLTILAIPTTLLILHFVLGII